MNLSWSRMLTLLRTGIFALLFMGTVGIYLPMYMGLLRSPPALDARLLGVVPLLIGGYIALRCAFEFAWRGHGTPAPFDPPVHLVVSGLYRYVRNPMYSGMALLMIGEWLIWGSDLKRALMYLGVYGACVLLFVLAYEEPTLGRKFGEDYSQYRQHVPRFLPRLTPWLAEPDRSAASSGH